jgi:hypothetical protein
MAFLTIGAVTVNVASSSARLQEPVQIGAARRSFSGMLLSSVRAEKRVWEVETIPLDDTDAGTLLTAIALYQVVSVTGDLTQNVATNCRVKSLGETFVRVDGAGAVSMRAIRLEISEV